MLRRIVRGCSRSENAPLENRHFSVHPAAFGVNWQSCSNNRLPNVMTPSYEFARFVRIYFRLTGSTVRKRDEEKKNIKKYFPRGIFFSSFLQFLNLTCERLRNSNLNAVSSFPFLFFFLLRVSFWRQFCGVH